MPEQAVSADAEGTGRGPQTSRRLFTSDRVFVMLCSFGIAMGLVVISGLSLAGCAFANAVRITVPGIARFDGLMDGSGTPTVTITISGSWEAVIVATVIVACSLGVVALRRERRSPD